MDINLENIKSQMRKGMLEYCILSILKNGETYASSLITELKEAKMIVVSDTLYPLLTRLKNQGYLTYRWEESKQGPPRKYYSLTEQGDLALEAMDSAWKDVEDSINLIKTKKLL